MVALRAHRERERERDGTPKAVTVAAWRVTILIEAPAPLLSAGAIVFSTFALEMLAPLFTTDFARAEKRLLRTCRRESLDPNRKRLPLVFRAQAGILTNR